MAKRILVESDNGLHCLSLETGAELWAFTSYLGGNVIGGLTPAVDQTNNFIYYQSYNRLWKLNATTGEVLDFVVITNQTLVGSGNTILVDDLNGYFIVCYYYANVAYGGAIKVFDINLDLVWEVTGLNTTYKNRPCYHDGLVFTGTGDNFGNQVQIDWYTGELESCRVIAYDVTDGSVEWAFAPYPEEMWNLTNRRGITESIYCNGYIIAETNTTGNKNYEVFILDATDGTLAKGFEHTTSASSCAGPVLSKGKLFSGDLNTNKVIVAILGTGNEDDFAPFGVHQTNTMEAPDTALASLAEAITIEGSVDGGNQGGIVYDGIAYFNNGNVGGAVSFNVDSLAVIENYVSGALWDSSPMIVKNLSGNDVLLIKESTNKRVIALDVLTGDTLWTSAANMEGNLFFAFSYYESTYTIILGGFNSAAILKALNDNFTTLNTLIAEEATIITITSAVQWDDINANIASLNAEGVAVDVDEITIGITGAQFNDLINNFVADFNAANS